MLNYSFDKILQLKNESHMYLGSISIPFLLSHPSLNYLASTKNIKTFNDNF